MKFLSSIILILFLLSCISCSSVSDGKETQKIEAVMFKVEPFILNINSQAGESFMKMAMEAELVGPVFVEKAKTKTPALRDAVIMIVSSKTPEDLLSPEGRLLLKEEINSSFNRILGDKAVSNIFITDFIMQ